MRKLSNDLLAHVDALRRYARILTRDADAADDLVQGTLLRAYETLSTFRDGADLRVWLMALQHNLFIDQTRSRLASEARERAWAELTPGFSGPEGDHAVRLSQLRGAFLALPKDQREVLHLVALEGMSMAEAAAVIGVPIGTVMSRLARGREILRKFEDRDMQGQTMPAHLKLVGGRHEPKD